MRQFSLKRLFLAVPIVASPFAVLAQFGTEGFLSASLIAVGLGGLCLRVTGKDIGKVVRTVAISILGWGAGNMVSPMGMSSSLYDQATGPCVGIILLASFASTLRKIDEHERSQLMTEKGKDQ